MGDAERGPSGEPRRMVGVNYDITALVEQEEALDSQRRLLAVTLDLMVDPHVHLEAVRKTDGRLLDFRFAQVNQAACDQPGQSRSRLLGRRLHSWQPPLALAGLSPLLQRALEQNRHLVVDALPLAAPPGAAPLYWDVRAVRLEDGLSIGWRDASERESHARRLAASEAQFRLLLQNSSDVMLLEIRGQIRWISDALQTHLGWWPHQWLQRSLLSFCHSDDQPRLRPLLQQEGAAAAAPVQRLRLSTGDWRLATGAGWSCTSATTAMSGRSGRASVAVSGWWSARCIAKRDCWPWPSRMS